jgi:homoserine O-acetyltransferase
MRCSTVGFRSQSQGTAQLPPSDGTLGIVGIGDLKLENGAILPDVRIAVQRWGEISPNRDNVVLVEHALTGDTHLAGPADADHPSPGWWDGMVGPGLPLDTNRWCVLASNILGGCNGTTGPGSQAPDGRAWGSRFPRVSIRDQVAAELALADVLGIHRLACIVGGSMGGMRALEWMVGEPDRVASALLLAIAARSTADLIGNHTTQIGVIKADPNWRNGDYYGTGAVPATGLGFARRIGHLTYRCGDELDDRFANTPNPGEYPLQGGRYAIESYLEYHADKLIARFDPGTYVVLIESANSHDIGRGRGGVPAALASCPVPTIVAGVNSDRLFPLSMQREIADALPNCDGLRVVDSRDGHDGFLTESTQVGALIRDALALVD